MYHCFISRHVFIGGLLENDKDSYFYSENPLFLLWKWYPEPNYTTVFHWDNVVFDSLILNMVQDASWTLWQSLSENKLNWLGLCQCCYEKYLFSDLIKTWLLCNETAPCEQDFRHHYAHWLLPPYLLNWLLAQCNIIEKNFSPGRWMPYISLLFYCFSRSWTLTMFCVGFFRVLRFSFTVQ